MIKESHTKEIASGIPNAVLAIIKGNHFIANKRPVEINRALDAFLKNCSSTEEHILLWRNTK